MKNTVKAQIVGFGALFVLLLSAFIPALATDPTPPDPSSLAGSALANFGDAAYGVLSSLVTHAWVLAIFGIGIALAFVRRWVKKGEGQAKKGVA